MSIECHYNLNYYQFIIFNKMQVRIYLLALAFKKNCYFPWARFLHKMVEKTTLYRDSYHGNTSAATMMQIENYNEPPIVGYFFVL